MPKASRTFDNPILSGFHPDPSICRVGDDYYLVASSFEYFPGIPIFHSRDLVHFQPIGHVLDRERQLPLAGVKSSGGIFAPTIRYHGGRFYVVCTNVGGGGNFVVTSTRPEGPWSEPKYIDDEGFDPSLFFDTDGTVYYTRDGKGPDLDHPLIYGARIDPEQRKAAREAQANICRNWWGVARGVASLSIRRVLLSAHRGRRHLLRPLRRGGPKS
ncbi:MAG: family 43 glycosylhydrolase [Polyangiaceae bacterium]